MMNINIINKLLKGVAEQIPLVNSFYTQSPYESWNVKEVQYGSVSFVVTKVNTSETTTIYDAVLYYADRLLEDGSNRDSIHSDAATVIQTIVGALNQSDDEFITVDYPVAITLFEQSFSDELAGGYADLTVTVEGMGECFEDDLSVPDIVATSAYYTKEEIHDLFPLRTQLSKVAFSGSFNDLLDTPNIVTDRQYNQLVQSVSEVKTSASRLETDKLDVLTFNKWVTDFNDGLSGATPLSEFNAFVQSQNTINMNLAVEMKNAVKSQYVDSVIESMKTLIGTKASQQTFDNFVLNTTNNFNKVQSDLNGKVSEMTFTNAISGINSKLAGLVTVSTFDNTVLGLNSIMTNLAVELADKMDKDYFDGWKDGITNSINSKVSTQTFDTVMSNVYTKAETDNLINTKVDKVFSEYVKSDAIDEIVTDIVNETIDGIVEDVTEAVRVEIDDIVSEELQDQLGDYVTIDELQQAVSDQYTEFIGTEEFKEDLRATVEGTVTEFVGDIVTEAELASKNLASKFYVDNRFDAAISSLNIAMQDINSALNEQNNAMQEFNSKLSEYYTKEDIDEDYYTKSEIATDYYTKAQVDAKDATIGERFKSYYSKSEIDAKLDTVTVDLSDYPTKSEVASTYLTKSEAGADYYTKEQVNDIIDGIEVGGDVDLTNYYKKSETYNRTEIDAIVGDINTILNEVLYTL